MKKGICCNETHYINGTDRDCIRYTFLSDDDVTPSSCTIRLGDTDPLTGEKITDVTVFREYHRLVDHQVMKNLAAVRPGYTQEQKAWRKQQREIFMAEFTEANGYAPSGDDVLYTLDQLEPERYNLSLESLADDGNDKNDPEYHAKLSMPASGEEEESVMMQALREVASSLTGRKAEVYEAMIQYFAGEKERIRFSEIARKWGVATKQITMDQRRIREMIRKRAKELMDEE